jgi:hypothetical protein
LEDYRAEAPGLRSHYGERLMVVDGDGTPEDVYDRMVKSLREAGVLDSGVS